ncbi:MAG: phosphoadenylyl-sulfate reductase [Armatimonadetes bacterium]|nr:phosphoadenylyl-sulfate reductase [Armatimonadota bacterium]
MDSYTDSDLKRLSDEREDWSPRDILRWAMETFSPRLGMATAFGAEGCCLLHMLAGLRDDTGKDLYIFNLDTGYQFPETLALRDRFQEKYGLTIHLEGHSQSQEEWEAANGGPVWPQDPDRCCHFRKVLPLRGVMERNLFDAWITAIRRDQTPQRATAGIVERDKKFGIVKVNPLANWTKSDVWKFILDNDVPYNPLHDRGYPSIGCWPCTKAVRPGEDDRAGRWSGSQKTECGIHTELHVSGSGI